MLSESQGLTGVPSKKASEVEQQLIYCDKMREELSNFLQTLENRLSPILRIVPLITGEDCEKEAEITPLAESIRKIGKDMLFFQRRIRSILDRLEI